MEVMRRLWGEGKATFSGEFVRFDCVRSFPKPAQGANVAATSGGESMPAAASGSVRQRLVWGQAESRAGESPDRDAARPDERGRARYLGNRNNYLALRKPMTADELRAYHEIGVHEFVPSCAYRATIGKFPPHWSASRVNGSSPRLSSTRISRTHLTLLIRFPAASPHRRVLRIPAAVS
jgi:hypothetical protein